MRKLPRWGVRRGIDRKKVGCRSLIDANLEGQVGVNKIKLYHLTMDSLFTTLFKGYRPVQHAIAAT